MTILINILYKLCGMGVVAPGIWRSGRVNAICRGVVQYKVISVGLLVYYFGVSIIKKRPLTIFDS